MDRVKRTFSEEHKRKIREAKQNISRETRLKMSRSAKIRYARQVIENSGLVKHMREERKGKPQLPIVVEKRKLVIDEIRRKISLNKTGRKQSELNRLASIKNIHDYMMSPKFQDTIPELKLQEILKKKGIAFSKNMMEEGFPDIHIIGTNIVIFADGCYWHGCYCTKRSRIERIEKDKKVTENLQRKGYLVLRFWEHDIYNNIQMVENSIMNAIEITEMLRAD